jgi:hypothetical protein
VYGEGVPRGIYRSINGSAYQMAIDENDEIGTRRLVRRQFETRQGLNIVIEYVLVRVSNSISGWSYDTVIFMEGQHSPFPWDHNNRPQPTEPTQELSSLSFFVTNPNDVARHEAQDALSRR